MGRATKNYKGRGWGFVNLKAIVDAPAWIAAPIAALAATVLAMATAGLLYRATAALIGGSADDIYKILLSLAGAIGAPFVAWRTIVAHQQTNIARESHYTSLFTKAVEQLGATREVKIWVPSDQQFVSRAGEVQTKTEANLEVRLGAIYALDRIAKDSERDHWPIMEVLCAYVRNPQNCGLPITLPDDQTGTPVESLIAPPRVDIQAAITVIGSRPEERIEHEHENERRLDLSGANLQRASLEGNFNQANFSNAYLTIASTYRGSFEKASFYSSILEGIFSDGTTWSSSKFMQTVIARANFMVCDFSHSIFASAKITSTYFATCDFTSAQFIGPSFREVNFAGSNLTSTRLSGINFNDTDLEGANLTRAALYNSDMRYCTGLSTDQLSLALGDRSTKLPSNISWPESWPTRILSPAERRELYSPNSTR